MLRIEIPGDILEAMIQQARSEAPLEACGILAGTGQRVHKLYRMTNTDGSGEHFMMEPAEQFQTARAIRTAGLQILAIYHSHPETPARPSAEDIRLALTPEVVHVIVSLQDPECPLTKGFEIQDGRATEVAVLIVNTH